MFRLVVLTSFGLWAGLMSFGRDLSAEEQAKLDARRAANVPVQTQIMASLSSAFGSDQRRQGDYVPTLAELKAERALTPQPVLSTRDVANTAPVNTNSMVHLASATTNMPTVATTTVAHPEKLAAIMNPAPQTAPQEEALNAFILREVSASRVNVRSGPSTQNAVLGQVVQAEIVRIISPEENGWVKISVEGDGVEGYMAARFLTEVSH